MNRYISCWRHGTPTPQRCSSTTEGSSGDKNRSESQRRDSRASYLFGRWYPHERAILKRQPTMPELLVVSDCSLKEARGHTPVAGTSEASIIRAEGLQELNRAKE